MPAPTPSAPRARRKPHAPTALVVLAALAIASSLAAKSLTEFGFSNDREGVEKLLTQLADRGEDSERRCRELVRKLDSDDFRVREAATLELARLPVLDRDTLERMKDDVPPEVAVRIRQALKLNSPERLDDMIKSALDAIVNLEEKGMLSTLLRALEAGGDYGRGPVWKKAGEAARATSGPEDVELLKKALKSEKDIVRGAAVEGIIGVAGDDAPELLLPAAGDSNAYVKWAVAKQLSMGKRRECLKPLAELLTCDDFGVRWRSLDELRRITGKEFGYYAAGDAEERAGPAAKWLKWVEEEGATAKLNFSGEEEPLTEVLFNGKDLTGWNEEADEDQGRVVPPEEKAVRIPGWKVEDEMLVCTGLHPGSLRTQRRYLNYQLDLEYRTPGGLGDSGIGVFAGDFGEGYLEIQVLDGRSGDLYRIGNFKITTNDGAPLGFSSRKFGEDNEKSGEWNKMQVRVSDGAVEIKINDVLQNRATGGPKVPGSIVLRNEGSRVEFRNIVLEKL